MLAKTPDSSSPAEDADSKKAAPRFILMVQSLIERCLILQLDREQCIRALAKHAHVLPAVTSVVWQQLEKENEEFFQDYATRRQVKKRKAYEELSQVANSRSLLKKAVGNSVCWEVPDSMLLLRQEQMQQQARQLEQHESLGQQQGATESQSGAQAAAVQYQFAHSGVQMGYPISQWAQQPLLPGPFQSLQGCPIVAQPAVGYRPCLPISGLCQATVPLEEGLHGCEPEESVATSPDFLVEAREQLALLQHSQRQQYLHALQSAQAMEHRTESTMAESQDSKAGPVQPT